MKPNLYFYKFGFIVQIFVVCYSRCILCFVGVITKCKLRFMKIKFIDLFFSRGYLGGLYASYF